MFKTSYFLAICPSSLSWLLILSETKRSSACIYFIADFNSFNCSGLLLSVALIPPFHLFECSPACHARSHSQPKPPFTSETSTPQLMRMALAVLMFPFGLRLEDTSGMVVGAMPPRSNTAVQACKSQGMALAIVHTTRFRHSFRSYTVSNHFGLSRSFGVTKLGNSCSPSRLYHRWLGLTNRGEMPVVEPAVASIS